MAAVTQEFGEFNIGLASPLVVQMTYDDVSLVVASFTTINPGPATAINLTVNGSRATPDPVVPTGTHTFASPPITLLPGVKGPSPRFPFTVSISPA